MQGMSIEECLNSAYEVISKRSGVMINGQFVKEQPTLTEHIAFQVSNQSHT